jgi:hypothetical protein
MIMLNNQRLVYLMIFCLSSLFTFPSLAQPHRKNKDISDRIPLKILFQPPPEEKQPNQTTDAGSRGNFCNSNVLANSLENFPSNQHLLRSIVPTTHFGLTTSQHPIFSIYLPETSARKVVLSIKEEGKIHHSQTLFPISGKSGIVSFQIKNESPPLEIGKTYQWSVVLICGDKPSPNDPAIASWIRRIALPETIVQGTALEQASWYAQQGIWYDALSSLIQARRSQPNNQEFIEIWSDFLDSQGLKDISTEPLQEF